MKTETEAEVLLVSSGISNPGYRFSRKIIQRVPCSGFEILKTENTGMESMLVSTKLKYWNQYWDRKSWIGATSVLRQEVVKKLWPKKVYNRAKLFFKLGTIWSNKKKVKTNINPSRSTVLSCASTHNVSLKKGHNDIQVAVRMNRLIHCLRGRQHPCNNSSRCFYSFPPKANI